MLVKAQPILLVAAVCIAIFAAAPASCQWGFSACFWSGLAALGILFTIPFILGSARSQLRPQLRRFLPGFVFMFLDCGVWLTGAYVANMRIPFRLL